MSEFADRLDRAHARLREEADAETYLPLERVAELAWCHPKTVRRAIGRGELRAFRRGGRLLVREREAHEWIEADEVSPKSAPSAIPALSRSNPRATGNRVARMRQADPDL